MFLHFSVILYLFGLRYAYVFLLFCCQIDFYTSSMMIRKVLFVFFFYKLSGWWTNHLCRSVLSNISAYFVNFTPSLLIFIPTFNYGLFVSSCTNVFSKILIFALIFSVDIVIVLYAGIYILIQSVFKVISYITKPSFFHYLHLIFFKFNYVFYLQETSVTFQIITKTSSLLQ